MKIRNGISILLLTSISLGFPLVPTALAQENLVPGSFSVPPSVSSSRAEQHRLSGEEKLHALALTRFHFIALKQFHSGLFSSGEDLQTLSESEAYILNTALNAFLVSPDRETMLLEALRQNKEVRLRFSIPEQEKEYRIIRHPTKPLLYRLGPIVKTVPASIEIRPLLDQPIAFQITLQKENKRYVYDVDWLGKITRASERRSSRIGSHVASLELMSRVSEQA